MEDEDEDTVDINTEVLDDHCLKDIVLDSDEEGSEFAGRVLSGVRRRYSSGLEKRTLNAPGFIRIQDNDNVTEHYFNQNLASSRRAVTGDHDDAGILELQEETSCRANCIIEKDRERLECIASDTYSQELGEPSHVDALDFVDQFLSVNNLNLPEKFESGRAADRINSPPSFTAKGARTLATRKTLAAKGRESGIYDWDEKKTTERNFSDKMLDEEFDVGSLEQPSENDECETNGQDVFDFGLDTQMAAEAMEALIHATLPPNSRSKCNQGAPKNKVCNPSDDASKDIKSKDCADTERAGSVSQIYRKQTKNMKSSFSNLNGNAFCPFGKNSENLKEYSSPSSIKTSVIRTEPLAAKYSNYIHSLTKKKSMHGSNCRVVSQRKEDGISERDNLKGVGYNLSPSKFVKSNQDGEDMLVKEIRKSPYIAKGKACQTSVSLERSKEPTSRFERKTSTNLEFYVPKKRRKKSSVHVEVCKTFERKPLISGFDASAEATNVKRTQQRRNISGLSGTSSFLKLDPWCYPKRKRTRKGVPHRSNGSSDSSALFRLADDENENKIPIENRKSIKRMEGPLVCSQIEFQSFPERRPSVNLSNCRILDQSLPGVFKCESSIISEQMVPADLNRSKPSKQSGKSDIMDPSSSGYHSESIELDAVSADTKTSRTSKSDQECKIPGKKICSRPSLMKELTRLGYNESLPNFLPRELRRCRSTDVSVLFSQHLESNTLNQQKKIIARLGFSVASSCLDATHFVTDRFVRTRNMLEAIAFGKPVVTHLWLESCGQANCFIDEKNYILRDTKKEKEIGFSMPLSLACARQSPLLKGRRVFITPNVKPGIELIQSLVKTVQGKALKQIQRAETKDEIIPNDVLILSSEEDYATCLPLLEKGAAVYDSELLLNGIVIQKLEFERHRLFTNYVASKCPRKNQRCLGSSQEKLQISTHSDDTNACFNGALVFPPSMAIT
ncbi:hypothetical protein ACH5RR_010732 [Cinchona calisaya]|uniref:BRCT domain-containing protein n=1 Tax=Cinchona calisaya TaxID=153742 RepID=A0ABD3AJS2_9GENT